MCNMPYNRHAVLTWKTKSLPPFLLLTVYYKQVKRLFLPPSADPLNSHFKKYVLHVVRSIVEAVL